MNPEEAGCVSDEDDVHNGAALFVLTWTADAVGVGFLDGT